jgi:peptide methionine sulfoxide reductase MsrB
MTPDIQIQSSMGKVFFGGPKETYTIACINWHSIFFYMYVIYVINQYMM